MKEGYENVFNLYGGIFDWVNHEHSLYSNQGIVKKVHAYNQEWGRWVKNAHCEKVY